VQALWRPWCKVEGSTYRRPERTPRNEDGRYAGSISGGCLERDLVERLGAHPPWRARPRDVQHNRRRPIFGFGAGFAASSGSSSSVRCDGRRTRWRSFGNASTAVGPASSPRCTRQRVRSPLRAVNASASADGDAAATSRSGLEVADGRDARDALALGRSTIKAYSWLRCGASVLRCHRPPVSVVICGAGREPPRRAQWTGSRLARHGGGLAAALATRESFPLGTTSCSHPRGPFRTCALERCDAALVMTHNALQDRALLAQLLPSQCHTSACWALEQTHELLLELQSQGVMWTTRSWRVSMRPWGSTSVREEPETIALAYWRKSRPFLPALGARFGTGPADPCGIWDATATTERAPWQRRRRGRPIAAVILAAGASSRYGSQRVAPL